MHILTVGLDYKQTPIQIREKFAIDKDMLPEALKTLRNSKSILECILLTTCNRTEVFAVVDQLHTGRYYMKTFLADWFDVPREQFESYIQIRENDQALEHIFHLPCGLESMILGETQILGQVKEAFLIAQETGTTGTIFNTLFKQAITVAKRAQAETEIGQHAVSVSYATIELAKKIFGHLKNKSVLILGAGKMSELTIKHLFANGVSDVYVLNRTFERAVELAQKFNGRALSWDQLVSCLSVVDIVISSTGANEYVIRKEMVEQTMKKRHDHPLFLIDIAVPRDLEPEIHQVENAFLYDIDDLNGIVQANLAEREKEALKIKEMVTLEIEEFKKWLHTLGVVPIISALRNKAFSIQEETLQSILNKCPDLSEREIKVIRKHTKSIVNQLLKDPILRVKELAAERNAEESLELFKEIFALEQAVVEQEEMVKGQHLARRKDGLQTGNARSQMKREQSPVQL